MSTTCLKLVANCKSSLRRLKNPPYPFPKNNGSQFRPIYYYDQDTNTNYIFIIEEFLIIKYNLDQQTISETYQCPPPLCHYQYGCIDPIKDMIYLINTQDDICGYRRWSTFDLKTKKWNESFYESNEYLTTHFKFIPSPINQLHFTMDNEHYIMNHKKHDQSSCLELGQEIGIIGELPFHNLSYMNSPFSPMYKWSKSVYSSKTKEWMLFQEMAASVLVCNISSKDQSNYEWRNSDLNITPLPISVNSFEVILGWDQILFIFYLEDDLIECIDLLHGTSCNMEMSDDMHFEYVIKDKQNFIHLLKLNVKSREFSSTPRAYHFRMALFDLIPESILDVNKQAYKSLIDGFCREIENQEELSNLIPTEMRAVILSYYPMFI